MMLDRHDMTPERRNQRGTATIPMAVATTFQCKMESPDKTMSATAMKTTALHAAPQTRWTSTLNQINIRLQCHLGPLADQIEPT